MDFKGFSTVDFSPINREVPGFVYVWCWISGSEEVPFYVGQTERVWGRLDDYYWATFSASTDFRVGEAVRHLSTKGYRIVVKHKSSAHPSQEEDEIIKILRDHDRRQLLNDLKGFDYRTADKAEERRRVQDFIDRLLPS